MFLKRKIIVYSLLALMTAGYCWLVRLGMGAYTAILTQKQFSELPLVTRVVSVHPHPWQALAVLSLLLNSTWAMVQSKRQVSYDAHATAAVTHVCWLVTCFFLHGAGMIFPFIIETYMIK
jgi:hypothetical protein